MSEGTKPKKTRDDNDDGISVGNLALWLLVLVSLLLNVVILTQLLQVRRSARAAVTDLSASLGDLQDETLTLSVPIDQTIILDTELPIDETVTVPIQTTLPISTQVTVIVDAGLLGDIPLTVPIVANVPIDIQTEIPLRQTFAVHAPVELDLEVPVEVRIADTPFYDSLSQAQQALDEIAVDLGAPALPEDGAPAE